MPSDPQVLEAITAAFGATAKPEHFTNYAHCEECAEHDATLRNNDRETLQLSHVGNPGWDPLCFTLPQGKAYYLPTLARFTLNEPTREYGWYGEQLLFHLTSGGPTNEFLEFCNPDQRSAVAQLLAHIVETRTSWPEVLSCQDELLRAYELWAPPSAA